MKQFAVFGNPIAHSKSPEIHTAFAKQFDIDLSYERILAELGQFNQYADDFFQHGLGANITVPFKEDALLYADELSPAAKSAGAVNTLIKKDNNIIGDNTDGVGLVNDIRDNHKVSFSGKKVLIIGAGGAARGIVLPISQENPQSITIANRTVEKAQQLAKQFQSHATLAAKPLDALNSNYDIVINATSASLSGNQLTLSEAIVNADSFTYDMMYAAKPTPFMQFAKQHGAQAVDGLGMLVEQAAKSFYLWHGVKPETKSIIASIRQTLQ